MSCDVTHERLAAYVAGDLSAREAADIGEHLRICSRCAAGLADIEQLDSQLARLRPQPAPPDVALRVRHSLTASLRPLAPEIMTLAQTAAFLQMTPQEIGELMDELPAFELAGQVRVRRARLLEWIAQREREFTRHRSGAWSIHALRAG